MGDLTAKGREGGERLKKTVGKGRLGCFWLTFKDERFDAGDETGTVREGAACDGGVGMCVCVGRGLGTVFYDDDDDDAPGRLIDWCW